MHVPDHRTWVLVGTGLACLGFPETLAAFLTRSRQDPRGIASAEADLARAAKRIRQAGLVLLIVFVVLCVV
jgi:hypothetical protein